MSGISFALQYDAPNLSKGEFVTYLKLFFINFIIFNLVFFPSAFCQLETGKVTDIDGNTYKTVKIGNQWWIAENLKVTHYRNGDAIPEVTDNEQWKNLNSGAYCAYDNNESNAAVYGYLYNWYAMNDSRNIAPEGWYVPSDEEW